MTTQPRRLAIFELSLLSLALQCLACGGGSDSPGSDEAETDTTGTSDSESETETSGDESFESSTTESSSDTGGDLCGNGVLDANEVCDDGVNDGSYGGCMSDCQALAAYCGDGVLDNRFENCDEGIANGSISCNVKCEIPGTLLAEYEEIIPVEDQAAHAYGLRATLWNGDLTLAAGGWTTSVWRIDRDVESTIDIGVSDVHVDHLNGALGLSNGDLVLTGTSPVIYQIDEQFKQSWMSEYQPVDWLVGTAPFRGGFMVGAAHYQNQVPGYSSYYMLGFIENGVPLWNAIETFEGDSNILARDLRALSGDRGVLLSDGLDHEPVVRIYDSVGGVEGELSLPQLVGGYRILCPGDDRFFLLGYDETLVGLDAGLNPTFNTAYSLNTAGQLIESACAVLPNGAPVVAANILDPESSIIEVVGFDGPEEAWHTTVQLNHFTYTEPAVFVDASRSRVWVFQAGESTDAERFHWAAVIAI